MRIPSVTLTLDPTGRRSVSTWTHSFGKDGDIPGLDVVGERDHAHCLPDTETYPGGDAAVEALDAVLLVNIGEGVYNCRFLGSVGSFVH